MRILLVGETRDGMNRYSGYFHRRSKLKRALASVCSVSDCELDVSKYSIPQRIIGFEFPATLDKLVGDYDYVVVVATSISPFRRYYCALNNLLFVDLGDSSFHILSQPKFNRIFFNSLISVWGEIDLLKRKKVSFLGPDEVSSIPIIFRGNAIQYSWPVEFRQNLFDADGPFVFIGNYSYPPNLNSAKALSRLSLEIDRPIICAGPNLPDGFDFGNVKYLGVVGDVAELFQGASALLYLDEFGTGVKTKVIEAWSFMVPVVGFKNAFTNLHCDESSGAIVIRSIDDIARVAVPANLASCSSGITAQYERYSTLNVFSIFKSILI